MMSVVRLLTILFVITKVASAAATGSELPAAQKEFEDALSAAQAAPEAQQQDESYQRVYEAFRKLSLNLQNNSLGNMRRLVQRMNQLVGGSTQTTSASGSSSVTGTGSAGQQQSVRFEQQQRQQQQQKIVRDENEERVEQALNKLEQASKETDQNTLSQLGDDVNRLVISINDSYLRNIRRVVERVNRLIGSPSRDQSSASLAAQANSDKQVLHLDRFDEQNKEPGFPGWDEFIVAMDRMQKNIAQMVRTTTRLVTSGSYGR